MQSPSEMHAAALLCAHRNEGAQDRCDGGLAAGGGRSPAAAAPGRGVSPSLPPGSVVRLTCSIEKNSLFFQERRSRIFTPSVFSWKGTALVQYVCPLTPASSDENGNKQRGLLFEDSARKVEKNDGKIRKIKALPPNF